MDDYSTKYSEARAKFLDAAKQCGCSVWQYDCKIKGPAGELLACDVAVLPQNRDAAQALFISSGLHGIEGYFGSALQHHLLHHWSELAPPQSARVVFIHALNPYGFAWRRRSDAENVDANRNFILNLQDYRYSSPLYRRLDRLLNPPHPPRPIDLFLAKTLLMIARYGFRTLQAAVAEGQYEFPRGLFYGGNKPCWTREIIEQHLTDWLEDCTTIAHVDFHTGLGRPGEHKLLLDYNPTSEQRMWLYQHFDERRVQVMASEGGAYAARGSIGAWLQQYRRELQYVYMCAEFGTHSPLKVIRALRRENQAHHFADSTDRRTVQAKEQLLEVFCPRSPEWRRQAVAVGVDLVRRAIAGIAFLPSRNQNRVK